MKKHIFMSKKELYPNNPGKRLLGLAKAPIIDDRKLIPIGLMGTNLAWPAVIDSMELSLKPKNPNFPVVWVSVANDSKKRFLSLDFYQAKGRTSAKALPLWRISIRRSKPTETPQASGRPNSRAARNDSSSLQVSLP